mmetsp:Transcript_29089/g.61446  ORF Transcript_29089/g.61446 Transcript_29089/m.61446 type:complete len:205 (+) Transcript_29089:1-615(+)|eukprot:CAMPEP_0183720782 /NCGR_PEP_ID=MMETSP0737-20130205/13301_1 /TAXON_ID=385413 /ORGANISM="Thalassiosira miniscula, Strain CCMP1093" /LENGTH=204 /DNA_ID=CAMNT_0025950707 /DNA_START=185 /DNA_END=799 /DNA_ORIENTATION=-
MVVGALQFDDMIYNYGRFHNNKVNQAIHFVFIPTIQFTLFILGAIHGHTLHVGFLDGIVPSGIICIETWTLTFVVMGAYFAADWRTAMVTMLWSGPQLIASHHIAASADASAYNIIGKSYELKEVALYLHVAAWIAQIYGHGVHEKRAPALLSNVFYSLLAPFFVTFEVMNGLFGYKKDEMRVIKIRIEKDIAEFKEGTGSKAV